MRSFRAFPCLAATLLLATAAPHAASAVDGVLEINEACATTTGCDPGDAPGYPVQLTQGSYRLTGDLANPDAGVDTIVAGPGVSLDLNGFTIQGGRDGISASTGGLGFVGVRVRNGIVESAAGVGVRLAGQAVVEGVTARNNGDAGIFVGTDGRVADCVVVGNAGGGIGAFGGAVIVDNTVASNAVAGISLLGTPEASAVLRGNVLRSNPDLGISVLGAATLEGNLVVSSDVGIEAGDGVSLRGDRVSDSDQDGIRCGAGCSLVAVSSRGNTGAGIVAGAGANVVDCVASDNGDDGVRVGDGARVSGCTTSGNGDDGIQASGALGVQLSGNTSFGNSFGLFLAADTAFGDNTVSGSTTADLFGATGLPSACNAIAGAVACP